MESSTINTVLLVLLIPLVLAFWKTLGAEIKSVSQAMLEQGSKINDSLEGLNNTVNHLDTALVGYEGQGGVLAEVKALRERLHKMESRMTALMIHTNLPTDVGM